MPTKRKWHLTRGGVTLAVLEPDGRQLVADYPCEESGYTLLPAFEEFRPLFEREVELLETDAEAENDEWLDIWERLKERGLFVESLDGRMRFDILWVHFRDGRAWWWPLYNSPATVLPAQEGRRA